MHFALPRFPAFALIALALGASHHSRAAAVAPDRAVENFAVFARAYGYVRFFHPSDAASAIDWDKFALHGAERVRDVANDAALGDILRELFTPLAAGDLQIVDATTPPLTAEQTRVVPDQRVTYWQHLGVELGQQSNIYKSRRVFAGSSERRALFDGLPPVALLEKALGAGLKLRLPVVLPISTEHATAAAEPAKLAALQTQLAALDVKQLGPDDWRLRVGCIVTTWNVFQHFHPYIDRVGAKWDETLRPALRRTLQDRTRLDYHATLSELVAHLQDGHGYVYGRGTDVGGIPIRVAAIEDQIVVTGAAPDAPLRKGDVLLSLDGTPAVELLREREHYVSGSPHLRRFRALNQFGEGALDSPVRIERLRDGARETMDYTRARDRRSFFFNSIGEFEFPRFVELQPGIFYVNLPSITHTELAEKLPQLATAKGVIFDQRWDGRRMDMKPEERVSPHRHVIPHLTDTTVHASPMLTPRIMLPDREGWTYRESSWPVEPKAPRLSGRVIFINEPPVVSYGETCMAMIAHYKLATLVGAPTAGCNGNANYILLPGGFRIMWTGMEVIQHDRTPFYGIGFVPEFPVTRTLDAVKAGRDEYLERALAVIAEGLRARS